MNNLTIAPTDQPLTQYLTLSEQQLEIIEKETEKNVEEVMGGFFGSIEDSIDNYEDFTITIPVYIRPSKDLISNDSSWHIYTKERNFSTAELLAFCSKGAYKGHEKDYSRGGALIFVRGRLEPYLTRDDYTCAKIRQVFECNPMHLLSGIQPYGSNHIMVKVDEYTDQNGTLVLSNGAVLRATTNSHKYYKMIKEWISWAYEFFLDPSKSDEEIEENKPDIKGAIKSRIKRRDEKYS